MERPFVVVVASVGEWRLQRHINAALERIAAEAATTVERISYLDTGTGTWFTAAIQYRAGRDLFPERGREPSD